MLTNIQIEELASRMAIPLVFVGFKDEIPSKLKVNKSYIINLQDEYDEDGNQNGGSHWTALQIQELKNGKIQPFYFDSYGAEPPENIKQLVKKQFKMYLPFSTKDVQSLMGEVCGYYCLAWLFFINNFEKRTDDIYIDTENFLSLFDDLKTSIDFKRNEYFLKMFFQPKEKHLRKEIDVIQDTNIITEGNVERINVNVNYK